MADPLAAPATSPETNTPGQNEAAYWLAQLESAEEREETWLKEAQAAVDLYEGQTRRDNAFNVLYSNTETLLPAIYSNPPRPVVQRRYDDPDPLGKAVSEACKRGLEYAIDTPDTKYTPFHDLFQAAVLGALVPGRAVTRFKYDPEFVGPSGEETEGPGVTAGSNAKPEDQSDETESSEVVPKQEPAGGSPIQDAMGVPTAAAAPSPGVPPLPDTPQGGDAVKYEAVCGSNWPHDRFRHGYARRWSDVPWIAYEHRMTKADVTQNFGRGWAERLKYEVSERKDGKEGPEREKDSKGAPKTCQIFEVWHKSRKRIVFIAPCWKEGIVGKRLDDPLGLPGFFDCPPPLMFVNRNTNLVPVVPYKMYEEQAKELNRVSMRINRIISALKVRGFYNGQIRELENLMQQPENQILPAQNVALLAESGGLEKHIWLMPLDKLTAVLQQLYLQRQQVKQVIYEITGLSDILRGASVASETATAQNIKNQWGTLRLKDMQSKSELYIRDCLRIVAAIQGKHFSLETWQKMTELPWPSAADKQKAQQQAQMIQQQALQAMQALPPPAPPQNAPQGPPAAPPQPPAPAPAPPSPAQPGSAPPGAPPQAAAQADPRAQIQQKVQQGMQSLAPVLQAPFTWDDVLGVLASNFSRGYRIDVETDSTVAVESNDDKQQITELFGTMAQMVQSFMPLLQAQIMPPAVVKAMLTTTARRFRFGSEVEEALKGMADQMPPPPPDPALAKAQADMQRDQQKGQIDQQMAGIKMKAEQAKTQNEMQQGQMDMQVAQAELEIKKQELALKQQELALKAQEIQQKEQLNQVTHDGKLQVASATRDAKMMQIEAQRAAAMQPKPANGMQ